MDKKAISMVEISMVALGAGYYAGTRNVRGGVSVLYCPGDDCMGQAEKEMDGATS